ncbi:MAG TPA: nitrilase-related carbon-nitrogen hydrolase, partial [Gammaproteobacteria bacterium]|nr:nitrilase-related carbon-nitrogen hydrolase [Gammaproteobacteria bacterium]
DKGNFIDRYDKIHLFDVALSNNETYHESGTTVPGNKLTVVNTPFGKIGLTVCYDLRFPELFRCLFNMGAEIFVVPSAFTLSTGKSHWQILTRSRAIDNFCYVIGACQGGTHPNSRKTYGNSLIVGPWGNIISIKKNIKPGIIYGNIDREKIYECRRIIPIDRHQKIFYEGKSSPHHKSRV